MIVAMRVATYYKRDLKRPAALKFEAAGLRWLNPGTGVAQIIREGPGFLETEFIPQGECSPQAALRFGRQLATIHALGADWYGQPPAGYSGEGFIGLAPLPLITTKPDPAGEGTGTWGKFYAEERLLPYLAPTRDQGTFEQYEVQILERLLQRLSDGVFESSEPKKVLEAGFSASRIHGDLWSGNVLWSPTGAMLIDPASSGGHAETDLASLGIFGQRYLEQIYAGYQEISPLTPGWEERVRLHQLHLLIVHAYLFGASYGKETMAVVKYYVGG